MRCNNADADYADYSNDNNDNISNNNDDNKNYKNKSIITSIVTAIEIVLTTIKPMMMKDDISKQRLSLYLISYVAL